jgi:hypothetical protein
MKKIYISIMLLLAGLFVLGQDTTISVMYATTTPEIDGVEEEIWDSVDPVPIDKKYGSEEPTVTAYWKAMWDEVAFYVLIYVEDDDHYPSWESGGSWYEYDQPEVYFDVNADLKDGVGAAGGQGHYQVQPHFEDGGYGKPKESTEVNDFRPACYYCYTLDGENYLWEYELEYNAFTDKGGTIMTMETFKDLEKIGFDVYIIDQDQNITSARQRAVWSNTGEINENYTNMDDAGTIVLADPPSGIQLMNAQSFSVYPNPVTANFRLSMDCDMIQVSNMLGQAVETIEITGRWVNVESLADGLYFIEGFRHGKSVGFTKIIKE